jgi:hypothetical protein
VHTPFQIDAHFSFSMFVAKTPIGRDQPRSWRKFIPSGDLIVL